MKWPLLVWFAKQEPILDPAERERLTKAIQADPRKYAQRSRRFWWNVKLEERKSGTAEADQ